MRFYQGAGYEEIDFPTAAADWYTPYPAAFGQYSGKCSVPPFISANAPPIVMLDMEKDHKLYYEAYNDASDLDKDGKLDVGYKHSIDYWGYFDPYKCYTYDGGSRTFLPFSVTSDKYCTGSASGKWSGNFLNWLSMSRMDVFRKVLYGGHRSTDDNSSTVLEGAYIPQDAHGWGKEYNGTDTQQLTPLAAIVAGKRHLFCMTSPYQGQPHVIRVTQNNRFHREQWAATERAVCTGPPLALGTDYRNITEHPVGGNGTFSITDYTVRVRSATQEWV